MTVADDRGDVGVVCREDSEVTDALLLVRLSYVGSKAESSTGDEQSLLLLRTVEKSKGGGKAKEVHEDEQKLDGRVEEVGDDDDGDPEASKSFSRQACEQ